jgi:hypothetical protein
VILYRLESDSWKPYDVQRVREDGDFYCYNATLPGFSYIAIGVKQEVAAAPETPAASQVPAATQASPQAQTPAEQQAAPANEQPSQVSLPEVASGSSVWIVLGIIAGVLIIGVVGIAQYKRRNARKPQTAQMASQPQQGGSVPQQSVQVAPDSIVERVPEHDPANAVHQYILQMRARGATEQEIRTRLLTVGWDELVIDMEMMRR